MWYQHVFEWHKSQWSEKRLLVSRTKATCLYLSLQFSFSPLSPSTFDGLMDLLDLYWIPQHLCPLDCPSWIFLDLLALADWCLHGNKEWGGGHGGSLVHLSSIATVLFCLVCALSWVLEKAKRSKEIQLKDGSRPKRWGEGTYPGELTAFRQSWRRGL